MYINIMFVNTQKPFAAKMGEDARQQFEDLMKAIEQQAKVFTLKLEDESVVAVCPEHIAYVRLSQGTKERVGFGIG